VLRHELGQARDFLLCPFSSDQIQVALHLLNYNYIDYKIFASCAKFEEFHANSTSRVLSSKENILGASVCFNDDNQSVIFTATSLKIELRRCNLISLFFIKGIKTKVIFQN
jgi:hypothetical protein